MNFWHRLTSKIAFPIKRLSLPLSVYLVFILLGLIIFTNQLHFFYQDEFENMLAGKFILSGNLPYTGFFTHHNPGAFFLSTVIQLFSGTSFVRFRLILGIIYLSSYFLFFLYIRKKFGILESKILLWFYVLITFGATYFWAQMLLADTLSAYLLAPVYIILVLTALKNSSLTKFDLWIVSILTSFAVITTMTQVYSCLAIYLLTLFLFLKRRNVSLLKFLIILASPYLLFLTYLLLTGSIKEYYYQAIDYNLNYYIKLPGNTSAKNPLRVIIIFLVNFFWNFKAALLQVKDLSLGSPFVHTLALSNAVMLVFLALKRKYYLLVFLWVFLSLITARGNPYTTSETDYQTVVYHFISIFNGLLAIYLLFKEAAIAESQQIKKILFTGLFFLLGIYLASLFFFFFDKWLDKTYQKYMGTLPLIYDQPQIAPTLEKLLTALNSQYYYIAPFDFENQYYMKKKLASKYLVILPAMEKIPRIQEELLNDLKRNHPKIIVFNSETSIYQVYPGEFFKKYLYSEYVSLEGINLFCRGYKSKQKMFGDYDFERHFFFEKNEQSNLIPFLIDQNLIYKAAPQDLTSEEQARLEKCNNRS